MPIFRVNNVFFFFHVNAYAFRFSSFFFFFNIHNFITFCGFITINNFLWSIIGGEVTELVYMYVYDFPMH